MTPAPITIRADCTDIELSAAVAEHVAGLKVYRTKSYGFSGELVDDAPHLGLIVDSYRLLPPYATDANAVLPLLGQFRSYNWHIDAEERGRLNGGFCVSLVNGPCAYAPTFCRAACFALLRAN